MKDNEKAIVYDYRTIRINRQIETMAINAYESLGWELTGSNFLGGVFVTLSFKRDRKISGKKDYMKRQEEVEHTLQNIELLHIKKKKAGLIPALTTGIIGTLTFGGGMSMTLEMSNNSVALAFGIIIGLIGMGICAIAWPINKSINAKKTAKFDTLIENEYNKLLELCNQVKD